MKNVKHPVTWHEPVSNTFLLSDLEWTDLDPHAVKVTFHYKSERREWLFALDLVLDIVGGMTLTAGDCDVRTAYERQADGFRLFILQLISPDGQIRLTAPMNDVTAFADKVAELIPSDETFATMAAYELEEILREGSA